MPRLPKPDSCRGCTGDLWQHPIANMKALTPPHTGFSRDEGAMTAGVLVVAEALGQNEDSDALPLRPYARSGAQFERALKRCGFVRDMFRITNTVRCRPPHDLLADTSYEFQVIQHCRPNLLRTLAESKPRSILALGGTAMRELTGYSGTKAGISYVRGFVVPCIVAGYESVPVVGTFHPSFLQQGKPQMFGALCNDIQLAVKVAREGGTWSIIEQELNVRPFEVDIDIPF